MIAPKAVAVAEVEEGAEKLVAAEVEEGAETQEEVRTPPAAAAVDGWE